MKLLPREAGVRHDEEAEDGNRRRGLDVGDRWTAGGACGPVAALPDVREREAAGAFAELVVLDNPPREPWTASDGSIEFVIGPVEMPLPPTTPAGRIAEIAVALEGRR